MNALHKITFMRGCKHTKDNSLSMNPLALTLYREAVTGLSLRNSVHKPEDCSHVSR